jgi:hypothetical protein
MDDGATPEMFIVRSGLPGDLAEMPMGTQFSVEVGPDVTRVFFDVLDAPEALGWYLHMRTDEAIGHRVVEVPGFGLATAVPEAYDEVVFGSGSGWTHVIRNPKPGTLYFSMSSLDLGDEGLFDVERIQVGVRTSMALEGELYEARGCSHRPSGLMLWPAFMLWFRQRRRCREEEIY